MIKLTQSIVEEIKVVQPLNLKPKPLIQIIVIIHTYAYILITGEITAAGGNAKTQIAVKNCTPFTKCISHISDEHVDGADNCDIRTPMYNLTEYRDNYSDNLWTFMAV